MLKWLLLIEQWNHVANRKRTDRFPPRLLEEQYSFNDLGFPPLLAATLYHRLELVA